MKNLPTQKSKLNLYIASALMVGGGIGVFDSGDKQKAIDDFTTRLKALRMMLMLINFEVKFGLN